MLSKESNAMVNGISTERRKIMDIAKLALKMKSLNNQELKKTFISIHCLIAKEFANKKT